MREAQQEFDLIDLGAASALTQGDEISTMDESVELYDRYF